MSTNLRTAASNHIDGLDIHLTDYNGGKKGQMIQMHQMDEDGGLHILHIEEGQVNNIIDTLTELQNKRRENRQA